MGTMLVFYFFAAIVIWLGILSVRGGKRFAEYVRLEMARGRFRTSHLLFPSLLPHADLIRGYTKT